LKSSNPKSAAIFILALAMATPCISQRDANPRAPAPPRDGQNQLITASVETGKNGEVLRAHTEKVGLCGPATILCRSTSIRDGKCQIVGPGAGGNIPPGEDITTTGPGILTLNCMGKSDMTCSAEIRLLNRLPQQPQTLTATKQVNPRERRGQAPEFTNYASTCGIVQIQCIKADSSLRAKNSSCFIHGPGISQQVRVSEMVNTTGSGIVTLSCMGEGEVKCAASIQEMNIPGR
jgi:hypothetical protein